MTFVYVPIRKSLIAIELKIKQCINNIQKGADDNGFQFSKSKTVCVHFIIWERIAKVIKHLLMCRKAVNQSINR